MHGDSEYIFPPLMSSVMTTLTYYGVGILGIFSLASLGMNSIFGCLWPPWIRRRDHHLSSEDLEVLKHSLSERDTEIASLGKSLLTAENKTKKAERELSDARAKIEHGNRRYIDLEKQTREALVEKEELEHKLAESRDDVERVRGILEQTKTLLDVRTSELKVAEAFLSRSDRYAGADVMKMIETLNSEIQQTASIMADVFSPDLQPQPRLKGPSDRNGKGTGDAEELRVHEAVAHTEEILGEGMTNILQTFNHQEDSIILQIAFQASMCAYTEWIMTSWCYHDRDSEVEQVLQETYEQLRETEEQSVSARWRILTRKYVRQLYPAVEQPNLAYHIFLACANILITAGFTESEQRALDMIAARFSDRLALIVGRAIRLNNAIGDDVTSCEFVPIYCTPDIVFDPSTMENVSASEDLMIQKEEKILCTTDLGLLRAEKVQGEERMWHNTVLLRPKIVMPSGLTASPIALESSQDWSTQAGSSSGQHQEESPS